MEALPMVDARAALIEHSLRLSWRRPKHEKIIKLPDVQAKYYVRQKARVHHTFLLLYNRMFT